MRPSRPRQLDLDQFRTLRPGSYIILCYEDPGYKTRLFCQLIEFRESTFLERHISYQGDIVYHWHSDYCLIPYPDGRWAQLQWIELPTAKDYYDVGETPPLDLDWRSLGF